jgi:hypothetical protein
MAEDHLDHLVAHGFRRGLALPDGGAGALLEMVAQELAPGGAQRFLHLGNLGQDVAAGPVFLDHPLQAAHLAFDAAQPVEAPDPVSDLGR